MSNFLTICFNFLAMLLYAVLILLSCCLFTNAIEFLGVKLKLGKSATGSVLAVFGTSMPETITPLVAIFGSYFFLNDIEVAKNIALGGIVGSPFILITLALLVLFFVMVLQKREELNVDRSIVSRFLRYFIFSFGLAVLVAFVSNYFLKILACVILLCIYILFIYRTIVKSKKTSMDFSCEELLIADKLNISSPNFFHIFLQIIISLVILTFSVDLFVGKINSLATFLKIEPVILSLIVMPFATELPEIINSLIWLKQQKDELAISNILGGIVFQATIPTSIGILFTDWNFIDVIFVNVLVTLFASFALLLNVLFFKKITRHCFLFCGLFYFLYILFLLLI